MKDIDWSKARQDQVWLELPAVYGTTRGGWYTEREDCYVSDFGAAWDKPENPDYIVHRRPWNGTGMPPVGTVCEWEHEANKGTWRLAEIKYIGSLYVIAADFAGIEQHYYLRSMNFRPILTPEQISEEERESAIIDMLAETGATGSRDTYLMQRLYDAGYRKGESK